MAKKYNALCQKIRNSSPPGSKCPAPIPTKNLFDLDVDSTIWHAEDLEDISDDNIPRWMRDDNVRRGIAACLVVDRCNEELQRLRKERVSLQGWFRSLWYKTSSALSEACEFRPLHSLLIG